MKVECFLSKRRLYRTTLLYIFQYLTSLCVLDILVLYYNLNGESKKDPSLFFSAQSEEIAAFKR